jgi:mRNA interferase RelE/StbE
MRVIFSEEGRADFASLPLTIQARVQAIAQRLTAWPAVSGAKPLSGSRHRQYRIRTGDWRVIFTVQDDVIIIQVGHRSTVYED